jgi:16S rRNA (guanine966-N2)-methyltransferase
VLDLFAGTGVLGLEALSRGAREAWFVERDARAAAAIEAAMAMLGVSGHVVQADAPRWLAQPAPAAFNVIFADPPYAAGLIPDLCKLLAPRWLAPQALVALEMPAAEPSPDVPADWRLHREQRAGAVSLRLYRFD